MSWFVVLSMINDTFNSILNNIDSNLVESLNFEGNVVDFVFVSIMAAKECDWCRDHSGNGLSQ